MLACSEGQRSYEWDDRGHGFFTWYFLQGLDGAAADAHGRVTLAGMKTFLKHEVPRATERVTGHEQVPHIVAYGDGERPVDEASCVLATVKPGKKVAIDVPERESPPEPAPAPEPSPPAPEPAPPIHENPVRPPAPSRNLWMGTWATHFPVNNVEYYFQSDFRPNGSYTDYVMAGAGRLEIRSGSVAFHQGRFRMHVLHPTALDTLHLQGQIVTGSYQTRDADTLILRYPTGGELVWTRVR